jgi:superfamily II DNA or RNA helicase
MQIVSDACGEYEKGYSTMILVTQIKHGELLEKMIQASGFHATFISGKSRMTKRKQVVEDMREGRAPIVIASTIADVGLDVPRLHTIVEAGAGKSSVTALQRLGRIMRTFPGKEFCHFITYEDTAPYLYKQIEKKVKIWETEPMFIINRIGV